MIILIKKSRNISRLPDCYSKTDESNNNKLLLLNEYLINNAEKDIFDVLESLDFFKAKGAVLDLYGAMYNQKRGKLSDEQYRYVILSRIGRNLGNTDYESILDFMVTMFNCSYEDIKLDDLSENQEACVVKLVKMPFSVLASVGFTTKQVKDMTEMLFPICVRLETENFEGTFEFGEFENDYDESKGFGNIEQTLGGYLGLLAGADDVEIPFN